jgi:hypothetical protein
MDNRRLSKKRIVEADRTAEQVQPTEHPALSYQQIYNSGIDHNNMAYRDPARQSFQALLQLAGNPFVSQSSRDHAETSTGFATFPEGPRHDVDLMEGFQLHLQQQEAMLRQHDEAPVAHHPNEHGMLQNQQEETLLIENYLPDPDSDHESGQSSRSAALGHKRLRDEAHLSQQYEALPPQSVAREMPTSESHDADHQPHNRPQESSLSQPEIHSLAHVFVQSVRDNKPTKGINLTDE